MKTLASAFSAFVLFACGTTFESDVSFDPPEGFPVSWSHPDCAPWDGPAFSIYLGTSVPPEVLRPTYPHLRISVFSGSSDLSGQRYRWEEPSDDGDAQLCMGENDCQLAARAAIQFDDRLTADGGYIGRLEVFFADGTDLAGGFEATPLEFQALCG